MIVDSKVWLQGILMKASKLKAGTIIAKQHGGKDNGRVMIMFPTNGHAS